MYFESRQVANILGVSERTFRYWVTSKYLRPEQDSITPGVRRKYSFHNLVEGAVLRELSKQKVTMSIAGKALAKFNEVGFADDDFACFLFVKGEDDIEIKTYSYDDIENLSRKKIPNALLVGRKSEKELYEERKQKMFEELCREVGLNMLSQGKTFLVVPVHDLFGEMSEKVKNEV